MRLAISLRRRIGRPISRNPRALTAAIETAAPSPARTSTARTSARDRSSCGVSGSEISSAPSSCSEAHQRDVGAQLVLSIAHDGGVDLPLHLRHLGRADQRQVSGAGWIQWHPLDLHLARPLDALVGIAQHLQRPLLPLQPPHLEDGRAQGPPDDEVALAQVRSDPGDLPLRAVVGAQREHGTAMISTTARASLVASLTATPHFASGQSSASTSGVQWLPGRGPWTEAICHVWPNVTFSTRAITQSAFVPGSGWRSGDPRSRTAWRTPPARPDPWRC